MKECYKLNLVEYAEELNKYQKENVCFKDGKIVLEEGKKEGFLESCEIRISLAKVVVGSWACITNKEYTCELLVKVKVDGVWSKYFSYGNWGLYLENYYYNDEDDIARMAVDEVYMKNDKLAEAIKYKFILRTTTAESPKLSLIAFNFKTDNFVEEKFDARFIPETVEYAVPKLNQNMVPVIGHEMCSATTTCMLLKFYGMDFSKEVKEYSKRDLWGEFEHSYVASLVADPGHNQPTFGNWVYNTAVMGAFGYNAYVKRMGSMDELKYHLAKVGPVGASIGGDTGVYTTGGHLLVAIGYTKRDGKEYIICNDPNINSRFGEGLFVRYEYPIEVFKNFWRGMTYVIE